MISDPKLPFASDSTGVGEFKSRGDSSAPAKGPVPVAVSPAQSPSAETPSAEAPPARARSLAALWLRRIGVLLFVFLCATLGVMLMILPWRPEWSDNPLLLSYPALRDFVASGFARGAATGLGVLNVWIGFWEAIQYQED
jgi:hypothetical protein